MKRMIIILAVIAAGACHRKMEPWPSDGDKQEVAVYVRTRSLTSVTTPPSVYQLFIYDKQNRKTSKLNISPDAEDNNMLHVKLFPGSYTGYCLTYAEDDASWDYAEDNPPEQIFLKVQKSAKGQEEAKDHLLGQVDFNVSDNTPTSTVFDLGRKVGKLIVNIENIPEGVSDLQINLSNIPQKMNLLGEYSSDIYTVSKKAILPNEDGKSETSLLVFPPREHASLFLSYRSGSTSYMTPEHSIDSIVANRTTEIKAVFRSAVESSDVDFSTQLVEWDDKIIQEDDWNIDADNPSVVPDESGENLVKNGSFEESFTSGTPDNWVKSKEASDLDNVTIKNTESVKDGLQSIRFEGKTYLYQDIPVTAGKKYRIHIYIDAKKAIKWRYYCSWRTGSTILPSEDVQQLSYQYQTDGYIDAFAGKIVTAPDKATTLRLEIRSYSQRVLGEGIYVDAISVKAVD